MDVVYGLSAVFASIDNGAVSLRESLRAGDLGCSPVEMTKQFLVLLLRVGNGRDMFSRHNQNMHRRLGTHIREGVAVVVLVNGS